MSKYNIIVSWGKRTSQRSSYFHLSALLAFSIYIWNLVRQIFICNWFNFIKSPKDLCFFFIFILHLAIESSYVEFLASLSIFLNYLCHSYVIICVMHYFTAEMLFNPDELYSSIRMSFILQWNMCCNFQSEWALSFDPDVYFP